MLIWSPHSSNILLPHISSLALKEAYFHFFSLAKNIHFRSFRFINKFSACIHIFTDSPFKSVDVYLYGLNFSEETRLSLALNTVTCLFASFNN